MSEEISTLPPEAGGHVSVDSAANPWPGLASYTEDQRHLFFGRTPEINEMTRLVQRETLTVLFGRSGLGKSSLLRAGVMPRLREQGYFPVTLRLDFSERAEVSPVEQVKALTLAAARAAGVEPEGVPEDAARLTLWEWFHTVEFWGPRNDPVTPILALDQFEEVFTLGRGGKHTDEFIDELADLIENRVPEPVRERARTNGERLGYDATRQEYKVILSLREDFVPRLDSLRPVLPAIMRNRFALAPLAAESACGVVLGAGGRYVSEDDARQIVAAVVGGDGPLTYRPDDEVEPAYLSVMCHELFRRMQALGRKTITRDLIDAERGGILEGLYTRSFEGIGDPVRFFVEDRLLTPSGYRGTLPLADATQEGIAEADLRTLVDRRLLRFEDRLGTIHLELSHDLLTRIVLKRRESRRAEAALRIETERAQKFRAAQLAQRRRSRFVAGVAVALAVLLLAMLWGGYYFYVQEHRAFYRNVGAKRGFPEGIGELSAAQTRRLPLHYVLVYKGIAWDGWRPHWKPAFKMMAVDQRGRLTINHGTGTFFWRAHDQAQSTELNKDLGAALGLGAVCQWEYTADAEGGIAYSRGLDRDGHMVWGCVYSPAATGGGSTRIAHYIGPDGFPQLQNTSAAEYIEIRYDADGREGRLVFLDTMARPAPGPDGEFGIERKYNPDGGLASLTVLDERGQPMIDRQGNAGLRLTYDANGWAQEGTSVGTDGKLFAVFDGWTKIRQQYDALGRRTRIEALDADDRPLLRRGNFCAIENTYDEDGDLVLETYLGTDGKPRQVIGEIVAVKHEIDAEGNEIRTTYLDSGGRASRGVMARADTSRASTRAATWSRGHSSGRTASRSSSRTATRVGSRITTIRAAKSAGGTTESRASRCSSGKAATARKRATTCAATRSATPTSARTTNQPLPPIRSRVGRRSSTSGGGKRREITSAPAGEPVLCSDGYHAQMTSYDERGHASEFTYLNLAGKPTVPSSSRYAIQKTRHDTRGHETRRAYYDAADKPVANKDGVHGQVYRYDEFGNVTESTMIGIDGLPVVPSSYGYAREVSRYDPRAYLIEERYYDAAGRPVQDNDGVFGVRYRYDASGNRIEEASEGAKPDEPAADKNGVHRRAYEYDGWGRQTKIATFGLRDEPLPGVDGAFAKELRYDACGNWIGSSWLDAAGKLVANRSGYARMQVDYDERNNQTALAYFDAAGQPCAGADKTVRWTKKYNDRRDVLSWEFFDAQGHLLVGAGGYAAMVAEYDARGNETKKTYLGADAKPLVQSFGYAAYEQVYAPSGLMTRANYYDASGQPALTDGGYAGVAYDYEDSGQIRTTTWTGLPGLTAYAREIDSYVAGARRSERYLAADGNLVNSAVGYAQMDADYDEAGSVRKYNYRDAHGQPAYGSWGTTGADVVGRSFRYYDLANHLIQSTDHHGMRPLLYVNYLRAADTVAVRSGLLPGDLVWQVGNFSFPQLVEDVWDKYDTDEAARNQMNLAWKSVLAPDTPTPVRVVVIREGKRTELTLPEVPANGIGVRVDIRRIPASDYNAMVTRFGKTLRWVIHAVTDKIFPPLPGAGPVD